MVIVRHTGNKIMDTKLQSDHQKTQKHKKKTHMENRQQESQTNTRNTHTVRRVRLNSMEHPGLDFSDDPDRHKQPVESDLMYQRGSEMRRVNKLQFKELPSGIHPELQ